jgi:hypothetical protein
LTWSCHDSPSMHCEKLGRVQCPGHGDGTATQK